DQPPTAAREGEDSRRRSASSRHPAPRRLRRQKTLPSPSSCAAPIFSREVDEGTGAEPTWRRAAVIRPTFTDGMRAVFRRARAEVVKGYVAFLGAARDRENCHAQPVPIDPVEIIRDRPDQLGELDFLARHGAP